MNKQAYEKLDRKKANRGIRANWLGFVAAGALAIGGAACLVLMPLSGLVAGTLPAITGVSSFFTSFWAAMASSAACLGYGTYRANKAKKNIEKHKKARPDKPGPLPKAEPGASPERLAQIDRSLVQLGASFEAELRKSNSPTAIETLDVLTDKNKPMQLNEQIGLAQELTARYAKGDYTPAPASGTPFVGRVTSAGLPGT